MSTKPTIKILRDRARQLRREQTEAEKSLWAAPRGRQFRGYTFRRQFVIGSVIADFCCFEFRIVVEIDGGQHADYAAADQTRSAFLSSHGFRVLRFWNNEVLQNLNGVLQTICYVLESTRPQNKPSPEPSPSGRGSAISKLGAKQEGIAGKLN
jgi:very-short-patch-repair endonuclease